jgi:hypothetical protein
VNRGADKKAPQRNFVTALSESLAELPVLAGGAPGDLGLFFLLIG